MSNQKSMREREHLNFFLEARKIQATSIKRYEAPDFLVEINNSFVGIEITNFFLPPEFGAKPQQKLDALANRAAEKAREKFRELGGPSLDVSFHMSGNPTPQTNAKADNLGNRLARAVLQNPIPEQRGQFISCLMPEVPEVDEYFVIRSGNELWQAGAGALVEKPAPDNIQSVIDRKEEKIRKYKKTIPKCEKIWLVIVNNISNKGTPVQISEEEKTTNYRFTFDKVFWLETPPLSVHKLKQRETDKKGSVHSL